MVDDINEKLRQAGFIKFERNDFVLDKQDNPISAKNFVEGHWFYETVYKPRKEDFDKFKADAKSRNMAYSQFEHEWVEYVHEAYKKKKWRDAWDMFRDKMNDAKKGGWKITSKPRSAPKNYVQTEKGYTAKLNREAIKRKRGNR